MSRGGAVLAVWPLSILWFGEIVTTPSTVGSGLVLLGLALSSAGSTAGATRAHQAGLAWAAICAVSIAGYHLAYKAGLHVGGNPSAMFAVSLSLSALLSIVRIGGAGRAKLVALVKPRGIRLALMGILCGGSFLILMEALARGGSGYVLTLRNTSVLFAAGFAWAIGERPRRAEFVGAAFVAAGAVAMAF